MGFGINLAKGAANTAVNALTGGIAGGLVDGIFGLFSGGRKEKKQRQWQEQMMQKQWENELAMQEKQQALTDIQVKGQKDLTGYNLELQKNLWDYTNYENQVEQKA